MRRPRREALKSHLDFPPMYPDMVRKFAATHHVTMGPMDYADAISSRNQVYRYIRWLCLAPPDDLEALALRDIAQTMKCRITEQAIGRYLLDWHESPIAEWARLNTPQPAYKGRKKCERYCGAPECYLDYDEFHCKFETVSRGKGSL